MREILIYEYGDNRMRFHRKGTEQVLRLEYFSVDGEERFPLLTFPALSELGMVKHCFTTRMGGVSEGIFSTLNFSFSRGDKKEAVEENYRRVAQALQVDYDRIVCSDQTHTTNVRVITEKDAGKGLTVPRDYTDVDGMVTNVKGITLAAFFADCVPLYFADPKKKAIGLSHSGWRGTVARMGQATLKAMEEQYGTDPSDVICAIGPSICQDCYEVSEDVAQAFYQEFAGHEKDILTDKGNGKYQLDLWKANEIVLLESGIRREHLSVTDLCTCCNPELLFSHRASHGKRGNLSGFLCLREDF